MGAIFVKMDKRVPGQAEVLALGRRSVSCMPVVDARLAERSKNAHRKDTRFAGRARRGPIRRQPFRWVVGYPR